ERLRQPADGFMDNVHTLRDTSGADVVALLVERASYCGVGYLMQTPSYAFADYAFGVVLRSCATGNYSFGHELGHIMGSDHDQSHSSGGGSYPYSFGYQAPNRAFRDVMAYDCPGGCPRVLHFSNPDVNYLGQPTGVKDRADNARSLN